MARRGPQSLPVEFHSVTAILISRPGAGSWLFCRSAVDEADADQRLGAGGIAEPDDLLQPRAGGLEAAPGAERAAPVRIADGIFPLEVAAAGNGDGAAAEPDDARVQSAHRLHHV